MEPTRLFWVKPDKGSLTPGKKQILSFYFQSPRVGNYESVFAVRVEGLQTDTHVFQLKGRAEEPKLDVDSREIYFKPTPQGATSSRVITLMNKSHITTEYTVSFYFFGVLKI